MAELSQITYLDGVTYDIKDASAREAAKDAVRYRGVTTTALTDGCTTNPIYISGESYTAVHGDLVTYKESEFLFSSIDSKWHEFGDKSILGSLAYKDSAEGSYTPSGTVSKPNIVMTHTKAEFIGLNDPGDVRPGHANVPTKVVLPNLSLEYRDETLIVNWASGSVTPGVANEPTIVTLPSTKSTYVVTSVAAELENAPVFTGNQETISVS